MNRRTLFRGLIGATVGLLIKPHGVVGTIPKAIRAIRVFNKAGVMLLPKPA